MALEYSEISATTLQRGPLLKITFNIPSGNRIISIADKVIIKEQIVDGLVEVSFKMEVIFNYERPETTVTVQPFIRLRKSLKNTEVKVKLNVICVALHYSEQFLCPDMPSKWLYLGEVDATTASKKIVVTMTTSKTMALTFAKLYDDTVFTDFHLSTKEGSTVAVHKACLATLSDVFKAVLSGEWEETGKGRYVLEGVTLQTLQHLKDYLYLGTLPDEGLQPLLLLAKTYMIENLKEEIIMKLCQTVPADNMHSLIEFSCENNLPELMAMIIQVIPDSVLCDASMIIVTKSKKRKHGEE